MSSTILRSGRWAAALLLAAGALTMEDDVRPEGTIEDWRLAVWEREQDFSGTMAARNHEAFTSFLSPQAVFFGGKVLRGRDAVAAAWKPYFEGPEAPFAWEPDRVEVLDDGRLALSTGPVYDAAGQPISRFNTVWRLEDGEWLAVFDKGDGE